MMDPVILSIQKHFKLKTISIDYIFSSLYLAKISAQMVELFLSTHANLVP